MDNMLVVIIQLNYGSAGEDPDEIGEAFFDEGVDGGAIMDDISDDEDDMDSSVDLLIRFLQATFKKVSKRAKKASRSILPAAISPKLVYLFIINLQQTNICIQCTRNTFLVTNLLLVL